VTLNTYLQQKVSSETYALPPWKSRSYRH